MRDDSELQKQLGVWVGGAFTFVCLCFASSTALSGHCKAGFFWRYEGTFIVKDFHLLGWTRICRKNRLQT